MIFRKTIFVFIIVLHSSIFQIDAQSILHFDANRLLEKFNKPVDNEVQDWLDFNLAEKDNNYPEEIFGYGIYVYLKDGNLDQITFNNYHEKTKYDPVTQKSEIKSVYRYTGVLPYGLTMDMTPSQVFELLGMPHKETYKLDSYSPYTTEFSYYLDGIGVHFSFDYNIIHYIELVSTSYVPSKRITKEELTYPYYFSPIPEDPDDLEIEMECYSGDCYNGYGEAWVTASKRDYYKGNFVNGTVSGYGEYYNKNIISHKGNWSNGRKNGEGTEWGIIRGIHNGYIYKGPFEQDQLHGYGTLTLPTGNILTGKWTYNVFEGTGTFYYNNNLLEKYEGEIQDQVPNGRGKLYWQDGTVEDAEMVNGWPAKWFQSDEKIFQDSIWNDLLVLDFDEEDVIENKIDILNEEDFCEVFMNIIRVVPERFESIKGEKETKGFGQTSYKPTVVFTEAVTTYNITGTNPIEYRISLAELSDKPIAEEVFSRLKDKINSCITEFTGVNISEKDRVPDGTFSYSDSPTKHYDIYSGNDINEGFVISLFIEPGFETTFLVTLLFKTY